MAIWLKCAMSEYAFDDDIVPAEAVQVLVDLDLLAERCHGEIAVQEASAQARAHELLTRATADADAIVETARRDATASTRLGYAQGRRDGLREWHASASAARAVAGNTYQAQRDRLADMVVQATSSLLKGPALATYLEDALQVLDALAQVDMTLSVSVCVGDYEVAHAAIERLRPKWRDGTIVKLTTSDTLAPGSCVCESSQGYVDASLSQQLATLRAAARGALAGLQPMDDADLEPAQKVALPLEPGLAMPHLPSGMPKMPDHLQLPFAHHAVPRVEVRPLKEDDDLFDDLYDDEDALDDEIDGKSGAAW